MFHEVHVGRYVLEVLVVTATEVVESRFAIRSACEAVLRTFAVAGKEEVALLALFGEGIRLHGSELRLSGRIEHCGEGGVLDVAQFEFGKYEVVATIDVAVVFHDGCVSACACHGAYARWVAHPIAERGVEDLYKHAAHVLAHPFVEDGAEEVAPLFGADGEVGERKVGACVLDVCKVAPVRVWTNSFNDGRELQVLATDALEEIIEFERVVGVEVVDNSHGVPVHAVLVEQAYALHDAMEGGKPCAIAAVLVVKLLRSVDRHAHQPTFAFEEFAPFVREQRAVGLNAIADDAPLSVALLQFHSALVEVERTHKWFTAVPREEHFALRLRTDVLLDEFFEQVVGKRLLPLFGIEMGFLKIVAIVASQIAARAYGL